MEAAVANTIKVNGVDRTVDVESDTPLLWVLRDVLGMTGTKFGCGIAQSGAKIDGEPVRSCLLPVGSIGGRKVTTIEESARQRRGARSRRRGWTSRSCNAAIASPVRSCPPPALLARTPDPKDSDIDAAMAGNICRCGTYVRIRAAIKEVARSA
jgi:isoquinoline 1-oxidoreductase subunit alpha